jgi:hypothetical protein
MAKGNTTKANSAKAKSAKENTEDNVTTITAENNDIDNDNTVINNTSAKVSQEQQVNADGTIDIVTMIEDVAGAYIASSRSADVFNARSYRINGKQSIM